MSGLDIHKIITGTPEKTISYLHQKLVEEYTESTAMELRDLVETLPPSMVLEHSREIFSEPTYGLPAYQAMLESGCIPFEQYLSEKEKIDDYVSILESKRALHPDLLNAYKALQESVANLCNDHHYCMVVEQVLGETESGAKFCDAAYQYLHDNGGEGQMLEAFEELSPIGKILYATERADDLGLTAKILFAVDESTATLEDVDFDDYANTINCMNTLSTILQDKAIQEAVHSSSNSNYQYLIESFGAGNIADVVTEAMEDLIGGSDFMMESTEAETSYLMESVIDPYFEDTELFDDMRYYDAMLRKYIAYENTLSYLLEDAALSDDDAKVGEYSLAREYAESCGIDYDELTVDEATELMMEATAEILEALYMTEAEKLGEQNKVIRRHASDIGEKSDGKKTKSSGHTDDWKDDITDDEDDDEDEPKSKSKPAYNVADDDIPKGKPKLRKRGMAAKMQARALDRDVKAKKRTGKLKKIGSDIVQTGKAVLKAPGNVVNGIKGIVRGWKEMDDNRRREYMLKPGYRKKCFKSLKWAIQYGLTAWINPLLVPITYFCRKASKEKNKFIQNELSMQLQTEIKVCEEKIQDAQSRDDKQEKYKLMRIRDKLEEERVRVISNSKYV